MSGITGVAPSAAERVHAAIRESIISGEYAPGTMLSESDLAAAHGVSRTPIRAALSLLQEEEWVTVYPKRGVLVRELSAQEAFDIADARHLFESSSIQRATAAQRVALGERLTALIAKQDVAMSERALVPLTTLLLEFHRAFVEVSDNDVLLELYDRLNARHAMLLIQSRDSIFARSTDVLDEHRQLVEALVTGDWERFRDTLRSHMLDTHSAQIGVG